MPKKKFSKISEIIKTARNGGMYILVDDENRENEGDLVFCASDVTPKKIKFELYVSSKQIETPNSFYSIYRG